MQRRMISIILAFCMFFCLFPVTALAEESSDDDGMNMYDKSDFIEKEQPELNEETKQLISLYQRKPTECVCQLETA